MRKVNNPGIYIFLMGWWIIPFCFIALATHPINEFFLSYVPFFISFIVLGTSGYILGLLNGIFGFWNRYNIWQRLGLLVSVYALSTIVIVVFVVILDFYGWVAYFGGDAGGSFGLAFIPSIIIYFFLGIIFATTIKIIKRITSYQKNH